MFKLFVVLIVLQVLYQKVIRIWASSQEIVNESDQEIPQSQTTDNPMAPRGRAAQPSRDTRKTN